jgi:SAM-dependent methyltransferase
MPEGSDGYITNIDYTSGFYPGLSPHAQNFALLYRGFASPELAEGFTYCELGCGHGFSTALLGAANPQGAFWGIDFNPAHIASAEALKRGAGVENVTFLEQSFAEALKADLPQFDFIALHGVWSWISSDNRRALVDFLYARLKPGGVVYFSYNALPGWAAAAPLRQLLVERLRGQRDLTPDAIGDAVAFAARMRDAQAGYFVVNERIGKQLDAMTSSSPRGRCPRASSTTTAATCSTMRMNLEHFIPTSWTGRRATARRVVPMATKSNPHAGGSRFVQGCRHRTIRCALERYAVMSIGSAPKSFRVGRRTSIIRKRRCVSTSMPMAIGSAKPWQTAIAEISNAPASAAADIASSSCRLSVRCPPPLRSRCGARWTAQHWPHRMLCERRPPSDQE